MNPSDPAYAGQHFYSPAFLAIYDPFVLGLYATWVWRCPTSHLVQHYTRHLRAHHLDVGPGTGYFLEHARLPPKPSIVLLDPNGDVLACATRRLRQLHPRLVQADVCKPLTLDERFDSIAINYLLHCLPGPMAARAEAVRNLAAVLETDGVLFGATVLGTPELHTRLSRWAMRENNPRGIFDNLSDTQDGLRTILADSFQSVDIQVVGSVAVFSASRPRRRAPSPQSPQPAAGI